MLGAGSIWVCISVLKKASPSSVIAHNPSMSSVLLSCAASGHQQNIFLEFAGRQSHQPVDRNRVGLHRGMEYFAEIGLQPGDVGRASRAVGYVPHFDMIDMRLHHLHLRKAEKA